MSRAEVNSPTARPLRAVSVCIALMATPALFGACATSPARDRGTLEPLTALRLSQEQEPEVAPEPQEEVPQPAPQEDPQEDPLEDPLEETPQPDPEEDPPDAPVQEPEAAYPPLQAEEEGASIHGSVASTVRSRWGSDAEDHDLHAVASVDIETPGPDPFKIHVLGRGSWDFDGRSDDWVFHSVDDTFDDRVTGRLYHAYVDAPLHDDLALARLGRQDMYETPVFAHFDGARVETKGWGALGLVLGLYGGVPVHLFEGSSTGDALGGAYAAFTPWEGGRLRFDWMHLEDETRLGDHNNDLLALGVHHLVNRNLRFEGSYSFLEEESRDVRVGALWTLPEQQLTLRASYYSLFESQAALANEVNPFFNTLITTHPYDQGQLQFSKGVGEHVMLFGGLDLRRIQDEGDIGRYNRDFDRYYLTVSLPETLPEETTLSLTGEVWDSPDNEISTWGIDLQKEFHEKYEAALGSNFALFKYELDLDLERENVRTYYAQVRRRFSKSTDARLRYEFEDEEFDEYHTLRVDLTWRF